MDRLRSAFNRMIKNEQYSRFTLQSMEEEAADADNQIEGSPSFRPAPGRQNWSNICLLMFAMLLIFVSGYMTGYFSHHKSQPEPKPTVKIQMEKTLATVIPDAEVELDWKDIIQLLKQKLTSQAFNKTLSDFDLPRRSAGSDGDTVLANRVFEEFKKQDMDPWTDVHYVQLQTPNSERPNRVYFNSSVFKPEGYLAYSAALSVKGKLVYGNYGRQEDLDVLQKNGIELKGSVLLLRTGKITFAEQVDNAATKGASAVLIYPDPKDYTYLADTPLYGHVHLGSGDPYTPGFPSFNHTQFPPTQSSGLPKIPAQTISANTALTFLQNIGGPEPNASSGFQGGFPSLTYRLGGKENITVEVNNVLVNKEINNVFGVIKGFTDPDRYVVLGAQRDAWGKGYTKATVGTSVLVELAKAIRQMVERDRFRPRRSIVFASWSAGEYGSVGATEWLEAYMTSVDKSVFTYINLDGVVMGRGSFMASASPLLYSLLESTMKEVQSPLGSGTLYDMMGEGNWEAKVTRPMTLDDPAYPFLAFAGIPSVSFHFISPNTEAYTYYGTDLDNMDHLNYQTNQHTSEMTAIAAQFAGQMALRLVHDRLLRLDVSRYGTVLANAVRQIYRRISHLSTSGQLKGVSPNWLNQARGRFQRAAGDINQAMSSTDLNNEEDCRILNNRVMMVERTLLSPYVSPTETPFRHLLLGRGSHTLASIAESTDMEQLRIQLALATWNLQGCAYAMAGNIWDIAGNI